MSRSLSQTNLEERLRRASGSEEELAAVLHDTNREVLLALLDNPRLTEEQVLVLLSRPNLPQETIRELSYREPLVRSYRVKLAMARHAHTPRSVSLPLLRHLFLFDVLTVAATPAVPADLRRLAEEALVSRAPTLPLGERITLARRGTGRIAAGLILDRERQVFETALNNPKMTEDLVLKALAQEGVSAEAVEAVATHRRWSLLYNVRLALLRHPMASLARVLSLAPQMKRRDLAEIVQDPRMPANRRAYLTRLVSVAARKP